MGLGADYHAGAWGIEKSRIAAALFKMNTIQVYWIFNC